MNLNTDKNKKEFDSMKVFKNCLTFI